MTTKKNLLALFISIFLLIFYLIFHTFLGEGLNQSLFSIPVLFVSINILTILLSLLKSKK